jgi:hypothetical protein
MVSCSLITGVPLFEVGKWQAMFYGVTPEGCNSYAQNIIPVYVLLNRPFFDAPAFIIANTSRSSGVQQRAYLKNAVLLCGLYFMVNKSPKIFV